MAAEQTGSDLKGEGGLIGYCQFLAKNEPKAFAGLLGRVLPLQVTGSSEEPIHIIQRRIVDPKSGD